MTAYDMAGRIGDLRLQALCSYATFKDYNLAKRCLYLFAGLPFDDEGLLCACIYEKPKPYFGGNSIGRPLAAEWYKSSPKSSFMLQSTTPCCLP